MIWLWCLPLCHAGAAGPARPISGRVYDQIGAAGDTAVAGWACQKGGGALTVNLYRTAPPGQPGAILLASSRADQPAADPGAMRCATRRAGFRFAIPAAWRDHFPAQRLYVEAVPAAQTAGPGATLDGAPRIHAVNLFQVATAGGGDETAAIKAALVRATDAAASSGAGEVLLAHGTHAVSGCLSATPRHGACFELENPSAGKLIFGGDSDGGTLLIRSNDIGAFAAYAGSANLILADLAIDYATAGFTQGRIVSLHPPDPSLPPASQQTLADIAFDPDPQFPSMAPLCAVPMAAQAQDFTHHNRWGYIAQLQPRGLKHDTPSFWFPTACEALPGGSANLFRLHMHRFFAQYAKPGDLYLQLVIRNHPVLLFIGSKNITLDHVTIFGGHGAATTWVQNTGQIILDHFSVTFAEPTKRLMTTTADGFIAQGNWAPIRITGSHFEGMGDEAINIHARGCLVGSPPEGTPPRFRIVEERGLDCSPFYRVGDLVQIVSPLTAAIKGTAHITTLTRIPADRQTEMSLDRAIPGLATGTLPSQAKGGAYSADLVYDVSASDTGSVIAGNFFGRFRGSAIADRSEGSVIENNVFVGDAGPAMSFGQRLPSMEGPLPSHIRVTGNSIEGSDRVAPPLHQDVGEINLIAGNFIGVPLGGPADIVFSQNRLSGVAGSAFVMAGVDGVTIADNSVATDPAASQPAPLIRAVGSRNVHVSRLAVTDRRRPAFEVIHADGPPVQTDGVRVNQLP